MGCHLKTALPYIQSKIALKKLMSECTKGSFNWNHGCFGPEEKKNTNFYLSEKHDA